MKRIAVIGGRDYSNYQEMNSVLVPLLPFHIISGGADGADSLAQRFAKEHGCIITIFYPDWEQYGKSAGFVRNKFIVSAAQEIVAFHDGVSKGTLHSITLANNAGLPVRIVNYERPI